MISVQVEMMFDYASPWAFLANALVPRVLAGVEVKYVPVYLRGFEAFRTGLPYSNAKLAYVMRDFARCAARERIEVTVPSVFPVNGLYALRGALVAQRAGKFDAYHAAAFRAVWQEGRDLSSRQGVVDFANELGVAEVADAIDEPAIKDALRAQTESAIARGAFGVPTFFVGDELFWGHDRMAFVAEAVGLTDATRRDTTTS